MLDLKKGRTATYPLQRASFLHSLCFALVFSLPETKMENCPWFLSLLWQLIISKPATVTNIALHYPDTMLFSRVSSQIQLPALKIRNEKKQVMLHLYGLGLHPHLWKHVPRSGDQSLFPNYIINVIQNKPLKRYSNQGTNMGLILRIEKRKNIAASTLMPTACERIM